MRMRPLLFVTLAACQLPRLATAAAPSAPLPPAASRPVDFARDIQPIFEASCVQCHARGKNKGGFSLETRADFLDGGESGAAAVPGKGADSPVLAMVAGLDPETIMPKKGRKLTPEQVGLFRAWIDQGMAWPESITFLKHEPANLNPRAIAVSPKDPSANPIDEVVGRYFAQQGLAWGEPVDDRRYARRVWLDTVGLLPTPAELERFLGDPAPDKRARLVRRLLGDSQRYAEHWLSFWNDLLRNDYKGTGYIDGGRKQITGWIYAALVRNLPYDRFVAELVNPGAEAEGFTRGILWRGAVNASMVPPMQAAQAVSQVFLGVNLKCASCHDSFINEYTLQDAYGLAAVYADGPLEIAECDKPTGRQAKVKFLYAGLGTISESGDPAVRRARLAEIITGKPNGRLARTIVNRLWQRFLGHGLVEPVDEMDHPAWSPDLLDWLAEDLVAHGYDLKHTMERILTSRAYQLPAVDAPADEERYTFRGPSVRRLEAEVFSDGVMHLAGLAYPGMDARLKRPAALAPSPAELPAAPRWIWGQAGAASGVAPETFVFRRTVRLAAAPTDAEIILCADDTFALKVNGKAAGNSRRNSTQIRTVDARSLFQAGDNVIEVTVANLPPDEGRLIAVKAGAIAESASPAGLILYARLRVGDQVMDIASDASWEATRKSADATAVSAVELGGVDLAPWRLGAAFAEVASAPRDTLPVERASLLAATPLQVALGRPNREQVMTTRQTTATTLQALELTNGATLAALLRQAAEALLRDGRAAPGPLVERLYLHGLSRPPTPEETRLAAQVTGTPVTAAGLEDLLWILVLLPEFQLIR
jgi:mono/diheme cytochrome c family protein